MLIAVTGATGHLGANLVRHLVAEGHSVRALYHTPDRLIAIQGTSAECLPADVLDPSSLAAAFDGVDAVMHLAAIISISGDPDGRVMRTNVEGTRNVAEACLRCGAAKLVHFSSIHAFRIRRGDGEVNENHPKADASCFRYDQSKAFGEAEVLKAVERGLDATILNPTGVLGPYDFEPSRGGRMLLSLFRGAMPFLVDGGFDWVDARDVAAAALAAVSAGGRGESYILSGRWASFVELARLCDAISGRKRRHVTIPVAAAWLGLPFAHLRAGLTRREPLFTSESLHIVENASQRCSRAKAERGLGYSARPLETTLRDSRDWFRATGRL